MAIDKTSRKETITIARSGTNEVFAVPFEIENTSDLSVYDASGNLAVEGVHYNTTNYGLPAATANAITVTWVGSTPSGTYTFYRNSPTTQTVALTDGGKNGVIELAFDRLALAAQNALPASSNIWSAGGDGITVVGEPIDDDDASTVRYAQEVYSKKGYICPPVNNTDNNKALYAQSTSSFIWKDPFDVPYPTANTKILQVNGQGEPTWVDPVEYAPTYPTDEPKYLGVDSANDAWITVNQLPSLVTGNVGDTLTYQHGGTVAWEYIRWLSEIPTTGRYLWNSTGTGTDGAVGSTTTVEMDAGKCTTLWEANTDGNYGGTWDFYLRSNTGGGQRIPLFEFDCSAYSPDTYNYDNIESVKIKFYPTGVWGSTNQTAYIRRLKNTFVEGTGLASNSYADDGATWEKPSAPGGTDWNWGGGNFNAEKELDYDLPVCKFQIGTGAGTETVASAYSSIDITPLFIDAIRNRSGILRFCMYVPLSATTATATIRCYANENATNETELEIKYANPRKAYWQPWNFSQASNRSLQTDFGLTVDESCTFLYPHVSRKCHFITNKGQLTSTEGNVSAFGYATCLEGGQPLTNANDSKMHIGASADGNTFTAFRDDVIAGPYFGNIAVGTTTRVSAIWMANE